MNDSAWAAQDARLREVGRVTVADSRKEPRLAVENQPPGRVLNPTGGRRVVILEHAFGDDASDTRWPGSRVPISKHSLSHPGYSEGYGVGVVIERTCARPGRDQGMT